MLGCGSLTCSGRSPVQMATTQTRLTDLSPMKAIGRLAWPAMASMLMVNVFQLVDAFWVGRLGTDALGGMSASAFFVWCLHSVGMLGGIGVNAVVARRVGEGSPEQAGVAGAHGLLLAALLGVTTVLVLVPLVPTMLGSLGLSGEVRQAAAAYLVPTLLGMPVITGTYVVEAIYRGSGDARTPMLVLGGTLTLNAVLDPLLIFGVGPVPGLGIAGAAWGTVIAHGLGVAIGLRLLFRRPVRPRRSSFDGRLIATVIRIGAPIAAGNFLFCVIYIFLTRIIAGHGSAAVAAVGVGHRIEGLAYFSCVGFATAAATLVGQHLGAARPDRAGQAAWLSAKSAAVLVLGFSLLYYLAAPAIIRIFSSDPEVVRHGAQYLRIVALFETAMAFEVVLEGAFGGAGDSWPPMLVGVPLTAARIPVAQLLAARLGVAGIWWAISVTTLVKGVLIGAWFRTGRWKRSVA